MFSATTVALVGMALAVPTAASAAGSGLEAYQVDTNAAGISGSPRTATT